MTPAVAFGQFQPLYDAGQPQLQWTKLVADLETPVSAMLKLADGKPNSFLLESVEGGAQRGRYSFIGLKPDIIWRCHGDRAGPRRRLVAVAAAALGAGRHRRRQRAGQRQRGADQRQPRIGEE